jgi:hypothetical protein
MAGSDQGQSRIEERLAAAEQAVTQLRQSVVRNPVGGTEDLAPLRAEIQRQGAETAKLSERVATLDKQLAARPAADPTVLSDLQANLGKLGAALAELDGRVATLAGAAETSGARTDQACCYRSASCAGRCRLEPLSPPSLGAAPRRAPGYRWPRCWPSRRLRPAEPGRPAPAPRVSPARPAPPARSPPPPTIERAHPRQVGLVTVRPVAGG